MRYIIASILMLGLVFLALSCGEKGVPVDDDEPETILRIVSGNNQSKAIKVDEPTRTDSLIVSVKTILGQPIVGEIVTFTHIGQSDGGSVFYPIDTTNADGLAYTRFILDTIIGVDTIMAVSERIGEEGAVFFLINTLSAPADTMIKVAPMDPVVSSPAGEPIPQKFTVKILDKYGNPVTGHIVRFRTSERCVVVTDSSTQDPPETDTAYTATDADGLASTTWILAMNPFFNYPSPHQLQAYTLYNNLSSATVSFNASATNPGKLEYYYDVRPIFIENCITNQCHASEDGYHLDYYYTLFDNGNLIPGDTNSLLVRNSRYFTHLGLTNMVEEDKIKRWVREDSAAPGSSGLNNYEEHLKNIIDLSCVTCHAAPTPENNYIMSSHAEIRSGGLDSIPNAIPGAITSLVVVKMQQRHQLNSLDPDPTKAAVLADSIINWIVDDYMRQY